MKKKRNFSPRAYWDAVAAEHTPELAFCGRTQADFEAWHEAAYARLEALLGRFPKPVPLDPQVEYVLEMEGLVRERVVFDTEAHMSIPCILLKPKDMKPDGQNAAILCCHGHGPGKDAVAGIRDCPENAAFIDWHNFDFGVQMAKAGFLTLCPELRGFGERLDSPTPYPGRDPCNVDYIKGTLLGYYPLTLNLWDIGRCVDYLQTRPEVDPARIGMMGISGGGTMTTFCAAYDRRIRAADIIGYVNPFEVFAINRANFCGMQILPDLYRYLDTDGVAGLIAPRPLLLEMGLYDECFHIQDLMAGYEGVRRIYEAAGCPELLEADVFPGPHAFGGNKAAGFFTKHLKS